MQLKQAETNPIETRNSMHFIGHFNGLQQINCVVLNSCNEFINVF